MSGSPSKRSTGDELNEYIQYLSAKWDLRLETPNEPISPRKWHRRNDKEDPEGEAATADNCVRKIRFLHYKGKSQLTSAVRIFEAGAVQIQKRWVHQPNADGDVLPVSLQHQSQSHPQPRYSISKSQRYELLKLLLKELQAVFAVVHPLSIQGSRTFTRSRSLGDSFTDAKVSPASQTALYPTIPIDPIATDPGLSRRKKRSSDNFETLTEASKKARVAAERAISLEDFVHAVDRIPVKTQVSVPVNTDHSHTNMNSTSTNISEHVSVHKTSRLSSGAPRECASRYEFRDVRNEKSANTSFTTNASSIFSHTPTTGSSISRSSSHSSTKDLLIHSAKTSFCVPPPDVSDETQGSTQYGSSFSIGDIEMSLNILGPKEDLDLEESISEEPVTLSTEGVFPQIPQCVGSQPLAVRYEITRVFQHLDESMALLQIPSNSTFEDYDTLWEFLKHQPSLKGKQFPDRSSEDAWVAALRDFKDGFRGVVLSGSLRFAPPTKSTLFEIKLNPLKIDTSHRLGRRFGNDRFLELTIPNLTGRKIPKVLLNAGERGRQAFVRWIVHASHQMFGITWNGFFIKEDRKKRVGTDILAIDDYDNTRSNRLFLFGTNGLGFGPGASRHSVSPKGETLSKHTSMTIHAMINWLIPLQKNQNQPYLKLFSRIALGLSKTYATVVMNPAHMEFKKLDILSSDGNGTVMNDGCGQISYQTAKNIKRMLSLKHLPSAFQARIGPAKGLWIVSPDQSSCEEWIHIYPSQVKWIHSNHKFSEIDQRTFEVVNWANPLKSAALNLQFLPLLETCAIDRNRMRREISELLENRLTYEIGLMRAAMESPEAFRKWARDNNPGVQDRLKHGQVLYIGGQPISLEEKINMLLDSGFIPKVQLYLRELARKAQSNRCDTLARRMNISVGQSTYCYMAIDFTGTLEPGEIHLAFSSAFEDEESETSETLLDGIDVLVARSPAHLPSDIQKLRCVYNPRLKHLKDIIVFSSKGHTPAASMLSGGDYDGDIAWVCWHPKIVDNFQNFDVPDFPDLIKDGYIEKDTTTYGEIMGKAKDSTLVFLERSFEFGLQDSLLGIATNFKEEVCYTLNNLHGYQAIYLSALLSSLVDRSKQGLTLTPAKFQALKDEVVKIKYIRKPAYKDDEYLSDISNARNPHIIDFLKFHTTKRVVASALKHLHDSFGEAYNFDEDLVRLGKWAKARSKEKQGFGQEFANLLPKLEVDITKVKETFSKLCAQTSTADEGKSKFFNAMKIVYDEWLDVVPERSNALSQILLMPALQDPGTTTWALLRASVAFTLYQKGSFVWWVAGKQLCVMKAMASNGGLTPVTSGMYAMLKPDATFVKLMQADEHEPRFWEAKAESQLPGEEITDDE